MNSKVGFNLLALSGSVSCHLLGLCLLGVWEENVPICSIDRVRQHGKILEDLLRSPADGRTLEGISKAAKDLFLRTDRQSRQDPFSDDGVKLSGLSCSAQLFFESGNVCLQAVLFFESPVPLKFSN